MGEGTRQVKGGSTSPVPIGRLRPVLNPATQRGGGRRVPLLGRRNDRTGG